MNLLRTLLISLIPLLGCNLSRAQQTERVVTAPDSLQRSEVDIETGHTFDEPTIQPELDQPFSGTAIVVEQLPDSATIMSQTQFLLEQIHAGTLLFPTYQRAPDTDGIPSPGRFSHGLIAGSQREDIIGLMGVERGLLGYGISYGPLSLQAYASADKYATFRSLTTVYGIGGSLTLDVTDWMSVTAFGAYYNKAPYLGMAAYPYINTTNYGGYMTLKPTGTFGMSLGVRRDYDPLSGRYYMNPIIAPSIKVKKAVFSIDFGPVVNEMFHIFNRPNMPAGAPMGPPGPRLLKPAGPIR